MAFSFLSRKIIQSFRNISTRKPYYPVQKAPLYWIDDIPTLLWTIQRLKLERIIGIDTETNGLYAYFERVCLIQISSWDEDFIIDPLQFENGKDLHPLNELTENPKIIKIFHGADYDISGLRRDFQLKFTNIFDTYLSCRYLRYEKMGLGDLVHQYFGIKLNKELTKFNWGQRPMPEAQIKYALEDVRYLIPLMKNLARQLREQDIYSETANDFERLAQRELPQKIFDQEGFIKIKEAKSLNPEELKYLKELYIFREKKAAEFNIPPFKILSSNILLELSKLCANDNMDRNKIYSLKGLPGFQRHRIVRELEELIIQAKDKKPIIVLPDEAARRSKIGRKSNLEEKSGAYFSRKKALQLLKDWRLEKAGPMVHPNAILPNFAMEDIIKEAPRNLEELQQVPFLGKKRVEKYGLEILKILNDCKL